MIFLRHTKSIFRQLGLVLFLSSLFIVSFSNQGYAKIEPVKIGVILPLSGDQAFFGVPMRNGLMLAAEDINSRLKPNEPPVELIIEDDYGKAETCLAAFRKLTDVDNVKWVFFFGSWSAKAIVPVARKKKLIYMALVTDPTITRSSPYMFSIFLSDEAQAEVMLDYILKNDFKRIAFLHTRVPAHERVVMEVMLPRIEGKGRSVSVESFSLKERDLTSHLLKMKKFNPDLLVFFIMPVRLDHVYKALQKSDMAGKFKILGSQGFCIPGKAPDRVKEGIVFAALPPFVGITDERLIAFEQRCKKRFKARFDPLLFGFPYDALSILYRCIKEGKGDIEKTREALSVVKEYPGLIGRISIDSDGFATVPMVLGVKRNGKNQLFKTIGGN